MQIVTLRSRLGDWVRWWPNDLSDLFGRNRRWTYNGHWSSKLPSVVTEFQFDIRAGISLKGQVRLHMSACDPCGWAKQSTAPSRLLADNHSTIFWVPKRQCAIRWINLLRCAMVQKCFRNTVKDRCCRDPVRIVDLTEVGRSFHCEGQSGWNGQNISLCLLLLYLHYYAF